MGRFSLILFLVVALDVVPAALVQPVDTTTHVTYSHLHRRASKPKASGGGNQKVASGSDQKATRGSGVQQKDNGSKQKPSSSSMSIVKNFGNGAKRGLSNIANYELTGNLVGSIGKGIGSAVVDRLTGGK